MTKRAFLSLFANGLFAVTMAYGGSPDQNSEANNKPWLDHFFSERAPMYAHVRGCLEFSSEYFALPIELLISVMLVEDGARNRKRRNNNQTYDYGIFQINDVRIPEVEYMGITKETLIHDDCLNSFVGSYILHKEILRASNFWEGVGNYHYGSWGRNPQHHYAYINRVHNAWKNLLQYAQ